MVLKNCSSIKEVLNYNNKSVNKSCSGDQEYINNRSLMNQIKKMALERNLFPNGTFLSNISKEAYIIHYNYLIGHLKKDKMKENNHWLL